MQGLLDAPLSGDDSLSLLQPLLALEVLSGELGFGDGKKTSAASDRGWPEGSRPPLGSNFLEERSRQPRDKR